MRIFLAAISCALICSSTYLSADEPVIASGVKPVRVRSARPAHGPFVRTKQGYMVPYIARLPGTDTKFEMVPIEGGRFWSPSGEIVIEPFWMGRHEVTWGEYIEYLRCYRIFREFEHTRRRELTAAERVDAVTAPTEMYDPMGRLEFADSPHVPATSMTQFSARQYTKWLSLMTGHQYRLPTVSQWQYACRAGTDTKWSFGDDGRDFSDYGVFAGTARDSGPEVVGSKRPNGWGLFDMHGNVAEWVIEDGVLNGSKQAESHLVCGGSWQDDIDDCAWSATRRSDKTWWELDPDFPTSPWWLASDMWSSVGFRIVSSLEQQSDQQMAKYWDADSRKLTEDLQTRLEEGRGAEGVVNRDLARTMQHKKDETPKYLTPWKREL